MAARRPRPRRLGRASGPAHARARAKERQSASPVARVEQAERKMKDALRQLKESWARARMVDDQFVETQRSAAQANKRFADFYDFVPMPFLVLDERLRVVQANDAAVRFLLPARFTELPFLAFLVSDGMKAVLNRLPLLHNGQQRTLEVQLRAHAGVVPAQLVVRLATRTSADDGERRYYVAIVDLSEIRRLEAERRRSSEAEQAALAAARAKDQFIAMLSHELRTPLAPILNAAETLGGAGLRGPLGDAVGAIERNVLVEARLIDDLLDAARVTQKLLKVARRPLSLHELIRAVTRDWTPVHGRGRLDLRLELDAQNDVVEGDEARLAQVLRNVLVNADKFTPEGGSVVVRTQDGGDRVRLSIIDTGQGMTAEELGRVFEPFQAGRPTRAGRAGLGLGLAISRGIVDAHEGRIEARSPGPDHGTSIEIELPSSSRPLEGPPAEPEPPRVEPPPPARETPAAAAPADSPGSADDGGEPPHLGVKVLVVDDHQDSAETLALVLQMTGYDVTVAHSVREAEEHGSDCDVLISDIALPDGSGLDLVRTLQRERRLPAIALSGYGTERDRDRSLRAGFAEHLTKPVYPARLLEAVRRVSPAPQP